MNVKTLSQLVAADELKGKRVFIRSDLNVPLDDSNHITDDTRIRASIPAIEMALGAGAAVMVTSHLGRPTEGTLETRDSLAPVAARIAELLGKDVKVSLVQNWVDGVDAQVGEVTVLENCRVNPGEKKNNEELHGLGLWNIRRILHKNSNLNLFTTKKDKLFSQQLEIY